MRPNALLPCLFAAALGCSEAPQPARSPEAAPAVTTARPPWLPPYDERQLRLLEAVPRSEVTTPAIPVYPALEAFGYEAPRPFERAAAEASAHRLNQQVGSSPRLYLMQTLETPTLANLVAQYGPPPVPEPDPWVRTVPGADRFGLAWARPPKEARRHVEASNHALAAGDTATARSELAAAAEAAPTVPGLWVALGRLHASLGDDAGAEAALWEALNTDPRAFDAHLELALLYERSGRGEDQRQALAHALAIHPVSPRARAAAARLGPEPVRPQLPATFVEVGSHGAIVVASSGTRGSRAYATCHAALRHEPELRRELLAQPVNDAYYLSVAEERLCVEVLLVSLDPSAPEDEARGAALAPLAARGELVPYVLFEVLGTQRPEWLRLAPDDVFGAVVAYVAEHVLPPAP